MALKGHVQPKHVRVRGLILIRLPTIICTKRHLIYFLDWTYMYKRGLDFFLEGGENVNTKKGLSIF